MRGRVQSGRQAVKGGVASAMFQSVQNLILDNSLDKRHQPVRPRGAIL
ncbi:hypothetical protein DS906_21250 [Ruegeria sp. A3M17]|nr:hypothetical protein DS906_21250 [Ruegeria sp. A3M17]